MKLDKLAVIGVTLWFAAGIALTELLLMFAGLAGGGAIATGGFQLAANAVGVAILCGLIVDALRFAAVHVHLKRRRRLKDLSKLLERNLGSSSALRMSPDGRATSH